MLIELEGEAKQFQVLRLELSERQKFLTPVQRTKPGFDGENGKVVMKVTKTNLVTRDGTFPSNHLKIGETCIIKCKRSVTIRDW